MIMKSRSAYSSLLFLIGLALAAGLAGIALWNMVDAGPFRWHISQPRFKQGLVEILVLAAISAVATRYWRRYGPWLALAAVVFYCRRQNIDYSVLLALVYSAGIIATGELARFALKLRTDQPGLALARVMETVVLGVTFFALAQWLLALTRIGFAATVVVGWALALTAIALWSLVSWRNRSARSPAGGLLQVTGMRAELFVALAVYLLVFLGLSAIAKANYALEYDSAWYGLRPDSALFHGGSIFSPTNLTAQVHYYPKLYELLTAPLSKTGDNSSIAAFGVFCWAAYVVASAAIGALVTSDRRIVAALALMAGSTPAMIGIAPTAKGDLLAAVLTLAGICKLIEFGRTRELRHVLIAAAGLILAPIVRLSVLPYVAVAACWLMASYCLAIWEGRLALNPLRHPDRRLWLVVVAAIAAFTIVTVRTYVLTGFPFIAPAELQRPLAALGFTMRYPVANPIDWSAVPIPPLPGLLRDFLFTPAPLPHVVFGWTGNVWLLLIAIAAIAVLVPAWRPRLAARDYRSGVLLLVIASLFIAILATTHIGRRGGDGNYYIVPITALISGVLLLCRRVPFPLIAGAGIGSALVYSAIFMMSSGLWWVGTTDFDWKLTRNPLDATSYEHQKFYAEGILDAYEATAACGPDIAAAGTLELPGAFLLPYRYEPVQQIGWGGNTATSQLLSTYFQRTAVDLLILPKRHPATASFYDRAMQAAALSTASQAGSTTLDTANFRIWAFTPKGRKCLADSRNSVSATQEVPTSQGKLWSELEGACPTSARMPLTMSIHWAVTDLSVKQVSIYVEGQNGEEKLMAAGGTSGSRTERWIHPGLRFIMRATGSHRAMAMYTVEMPNCP